MTEKTIENISIELNGKEFYLSSGTTITEFLAAKGLQHRLVVVELNGVIVPRSAFGDTRFSTGDKVEVVHFVGGG